jgi:hypothetical protein
MPLKAYVSSLQTIVAATSFVVATSFSYEERPPSAGLIKGSVLFVDGSQLEIKEFLLTQPAVLVIKYGYHYHRGPDLIFRYDNANDPAARGLATFPSHKHTPGGLLVAEKPSLEQILQEIVSQLKIL